MYIVFSFIRSCLYDFFLFHIRFVFKVLLVCKVSVFWVL